MNIEKKDNTRKKEWEEVIFLAFRKARLMEKLYALSTSQPMQNCLFPEHMI